MTMLHEAIRAGVLEALRTLYVGMPGRLEKYDPATGKAEVKPLIQEPDHTGTMRALPPIAGVPVAMPGGGQAALYLPPKVGDTGWIAFSHRSIEEWLTRGGDVAPKDPRMMDMTDAVFFPGLQPFSEGSLAEEADAAVMRNGGAKLKLRGGQIALGNADLIPSPAGVALTVPPYTGKVELFDIVDDLLGRLADPTLVTGGATVNPVFTSAMQGLREVFRQLKGSL